MTRLTIQSRIITYMIVTTVALIAVFTFMQVNNQLKTLTQQNILRAKFGAMLVKNALENTMAEASNAKQQPEALKETLTGLKQSGIIEDVEIMDKDAGIIVSTGKYTGNTALNAKEQHILKSLFEAKTQAQQYQSKIDKQKKIILQYVPLIQAVCLAPDAAATYQEKNITYIAKITYKLGNINNALKSVYLPCIFIAIMIVLANIFLTIMLSKTIIGPLHILNNASKEIAAGKLELRINLATEDEIEEVANTFNDMTVALVNMKARAENANPLTKLPGNNVIHEEIEKRLNDKRKFVVVYSDLDNFKAFNDKYGIGAGDKAIKLTAQIMQDSLKLGSADDFMGHEGGDDFVLLTTPEAAKPITDYIISEFDKNIRALYNKDDLERGYIVSKSREGETKQFPIMTLSLAGVSNISRPLNSYGEITNICTSVKKVAKKTPGSVFVLDTMPEAH